MLDPEKEVLGQCVLCRGTGHRPCAEVSFSESVDALCLDMVVESQIDSGEFVPVGGLHSTSAVVHAFLPSRQLL